jgi:hypothetical protein
MGFSWFCGFRHRMFSIIYKIIAKNKENIAIKNLKPVSAVKSEHHNKGLPTTLLSVGPVSSLKFVQALVG